MTILVTGATGFIGRAVCLGLANQGRKVIGVTRSRTSLNHPNIKMINCDLLSGSHDIVEHLSACKAIFHFAANLPKAGGDIDQDKSLENILITRNILDTFIQSSASVFVNASSLPVIGTPTTWPITEYHQAEPITGYHKSKQACENMVIDYANKFNKRCISFRITSPYGRGMNLNSVLPKFLIRASKAQELFVLGSGSRIQNFIHIDDIVGTCKAALSTGQGLINLAGKENISMLHLAILANKISGEKSQIIQLNEPKDPQEGISWETSILKLSSELGYIPSVNLEAGMRDFYLFLKEKYE